MGKEYCTTPIKADKMSKNQIFFSLENEVDFEGVFAMDEKYTNRMGKIAEIKSIAIFVFKDSKNKK